MPPGDWNLHLSSHPLLICKNVTFWGPYCPNFVTWSLCYCGQDYVAVPPCSPKGHLVSYVEIYLLVLGICLSDFAHILHVYPGSGAHYHIMIPLHIVTTLSVYDLLEETSACDCLADLSHRVV